MSNVVCVCFFFLVMVFFSSSLICPKSAANSFIHNSPKDTNTKTRFFRFDTKSNTRY